MGCWSHVHISYTLDFTRIPIDELLIHLNKNKELDERIEQAIKGRGSVWVREGTSCAAGYQTSALLDKYAGEAEQVWIEMDGESTGSFYPAKISGPPENCYPAESEDERVLLSAELTTEDISIKFDEKECEILEQECYEDLMEAPLPDDVEV